MASGKDAGTNEWPPPATRRQPRSSCPSPPRRASFDRSPESVLISRIPPSSKGFRFERFLQVTEESCPQRAVNLRRAQDEAREEIGVQVGLFCQKGRERGNTVETRHALVDECQRRRSSASNIDGFAAAGGDERLVAAAAQLALQPRAHQHVVIDDKHGMRAVTSLD